MLNRYAAGFIKDELFELNKYKDKTRNKTLSPVEGVYLLVYATDIANVSEDYTYLKELYDYMGLMTPAGTEEYMIHFHSIGDVELKIFVKKTSDIIHRYLTNSRNKYDLDSETYDIYVTLSYNLKTVWEERNGKI